MQIKQWLKISLVGSNLMLSTQALASPGFENTLNQQLGNGASVSCNACHNGATSSATATFPMANTYRAARTANDYTLIATSDSDGDGYINKFEVNGAATDFNVAATSPFTLAMGGVRLANVYVTGDMQAVEKAITAVGAGITVPMGSEILGGVAVDIYASPTSTAPVTLLFKAGSAALTSKVYAVDTYAIATADPYAMNTTLPLAATDWSLTAQGAVQINQLPAGADATYDIVVTRVIPIAPTIPSTPFVPSNTGDDSGVETEGGETEGDSNTTNPTVPACVGDISSIPLLMFLALLLPAFIKNHRKKII